VRNLRSVGLDLEPCLRKGLLHIAATRPTLNGLEMHLATIHKLVRDFQPRAVVMDPISNLISNGSLGAASSMMVRLIDFLKARGITGFFTSLTNGDRELEQTQIGVSSLVDAWLLVRDVEVRGERSHGLYVLKSRGMAHSRQVREYVLSRHGAELREPVAGA
jgi:circadian clock protein KaiC